MRRLDGRDDLVDLRGQVADVANQLDVGLGQPRRNVPSGRNRGLQDAQAGREPVEPLLDLLAHDVQLVPEPAVRRFIKLGDLLDRFLNLPPVLAQVRVHLFGPLDQPVDLRRVLRQVAVDEIILGRSRCRDLFEGSNSRDNLAQDHRVDVDGLAQLVGVQHLLFQLLVELVEARAQVFHVHRPHTARRNLDCIPVRRPLGLGRCRVRSHRGRSRSRGCETRSGWHITHVGRHRCSNPKVSITKSSRPRVLSLVLD